MEHINQLKKWQEQLDKADPFSYADIDVTARLVRHGIEATVKLAELAALRDAVKPFAAIINETSGRIPTERLSLANWHDLVKAFNERPNAKVSGPEAALSPEGRARLPGSASPTKENE